MPVDFSNLDAFDPTGRTALWTAPVELNPPLVLEVVYAGESNAAYTNAAAKETTANAAVLRTGIETGDPSSAMEANLGIDRRLFPIHVVKGWTGAKDTNGADVPFSVDNCADLLAKMPSWLMRRLSTFCANPKNFPAPGPTDAQVDAQAGN